MPNLKLSPKTQLSTFRKIAIGSWKTVGDPSVYGCLALNMDEALRYLEEYREVTGRRLTVTHMMGKAVAAALEKMPDANALLRFNRLYLRDEISIFFQVVMEDPKTGEIDLSGTVVHNADQKSLGQFIDVMESNVKQVRTGTDQKLEKSRNLFKKMPLMLVRWFLNTLSFLGYTLNLDLRWAGVPKDAFGSVAITNIGSLGLEEAYVPLAPYTRIPLFLAMGAIQEIPAVVDGNVQVIKQMKVFATFDHRILDGAHAAVMSKTLRQWFENPYEHFGPIEKPSQKA
ncbi:MAG: 2-oxo acid dehydrogenase [Deltaproteobacteria bacterium]|nr:MAG: 2-oxo acid dehydrogenase [Deltaproteobacteria bacterium]